MYKILFSIVCFAGFFNQGSAQDVYYSNEEALKEAKRSNRHILSIPYYKSDEINIVTFSTYIVQSLDSFPNISKDHVICFPTKTKEISEPSKVSFIDPSGYQYDYFNVSFLQDLQNEFVKWDRIKPLKEFGDNVKLSISDRIYVSDIRKFAQQNSLSQDSLQKYISILNTKNINNDLCLTLINQYAKSLFPQDHNSDNFGIRVNTSNEISQNYTPDRKLIKIISKQSNDEKKVENAILRTVIKESLVHKDFYRDHSIVIESDPKYNSRDISLDLNGIFIEVYDEKANLLFTHFTKGYRFETGYRLLLLNSYLKLSKYITEDNNLTYFKQSFEQKKNDIEFVKDYLLFNNMSTPELIYHPILAQYLKLSNNKILHPELAYVFYMASIENYYFYENINNFSFYKNKLHYLYRDILFNNISRIEEALKTDSIKAFKFKMFRRASCSDLIYVREKLNYKQVDRIVNAYFSLQNAPFKLPYKKTPTKFDDLYKMHQELYNTDSYYLLRYYVFTDQAADYTLTNLTASCRKKEDFEKVVAYLTEILKPEVYYKKFIHLDDRLLSAYDLLAYSTYFSGDEKKAEKLMEQYEHIEKKNNPEYVAAARTWIENGFIPNGDSYKHTLQKTMRKKRVEAEIKKSKKD